VLEAVVLVGGQGSRLRPLTLNTPKPLLPVAGVPFLLHQFARLRDAGVTRVVLATSYRAALFEEAFGDGSQWGLDLAFVTETEPMGTGGAIRNVAQELRSGPDDPVVILNGDIVSGHDLARQVQEHRDSAADVTLHLVKVDDARAFGCVPTDDDGRVTAFLEKMPEPISDQINAGCYVFRRSIIDGIPAGRPVSVERETFPGLLAAGAVVRGFVDTAYWLDLGTPEALVRGSRDLVLGTIASSALPGAHGQALMLEGALVDADAVVSGGSVIGPGATVGAGAVIDGSVVLDDAMIGAGALIVDSVIGSSATVGPGTRVERAVIGDGADAGADNELVDVRVWIDTLLPDGGLRVTVS
jgi:mannose-1-phosphate guanylyltransferase